MNMVSARKRLPGSISTDAHESHSGSKASLALAALGVVFGDIGTSPLYAFRQCFNEGGGYAPTPEHVFGILSLITWALICVVCVKYATFVLRADHDGEGGTLALYALLRPKSHAGIPARLAVLAIIVLFGAAMLYGDGVITPAISVLSALEGLHVVTTAADPYILPLTVGILLALFLVQSRGTGSLGGVFGPIMILWFSSIGIAGAFEVAKEPIVLNALNPMHAIGFLLNNHWSGFLVLGAVVLCVSGVEAMYADLAHFGRNAIRLAWYAVVFPALILNYYGQGALTLADPKNLSSPFFLLFPDFAIKPMVVLATVSTVIAAQAMIAGAFSLTQQAMQLGYLPRLRIVHTSRKNVGQIYVPMVNFAMMFACIALVLTFRTSDHLGSAYGLAVTVTMFATSITFFVVLVRRWKWRMWQALALVSLFWTWDIGFLISNSLKIVSGAWVPLVISAVLMLLFTTWVDGRRRLALALADLSVPVNEFLRDVGNIDCSGRLEETAIFFTPQTIGIPFVLRHQWLRSHVLHEEIVLMTIVNERRPYVPYSERILIENLGPRLVRVVARYGFLEEPKISEIMNCCEHTHGKTFVDPTFFLVDPKLRSIHGSNSFPGWRRGLLGFMMRNARPLTDYLNLPVDRVVQFGVEIRV
jgi:KUP system potassium uptake protein